MPVFQVTTSSGTYPAVVERGILSRWRDFLPAQHNQVFAVTEQRVWQLHAHLFSKPPKAVLFLPGGEENKRLAPLETLAEQLVDQGADRATVVVAFGGGIVNDMAGFLAATFLRGIPVVQIPTTLLAQVDASVGGKTGVNLTRGKNLIGSFHQPHAVLIDPSLLETLPEREYRAGLYEVIKCGVIASPELFHLLRDRKDAVLARDPDLVDCLISESVRIKAEVVSADEKETGLRRILNFGHTVGHAIEAETRYARFLHGEAVAIGMRAATRLAHDANALNLHDTQAIEDLIRDYGPVPETSGISASSLFRRLTSDKKTRNGRVHFVLPVSIGKTEVRADLPPELILSAIEHSLA